MLPHRTPFMTSLVGAPCPSQPKTFMSFFFYLSQLLIPYPRATRNHPCKYCHCTTTHPSSCQLASIHPTYTFGHTIITLDIHNLFHPNSAGKPRSTSRLPSSINVQETCLRYKHNIRLLVGHYNGKKKSKHMRNEREQCANP